MARSASASSSSPGSPLTPTAPMRASPSKTATPPRKNVKNGSKLARSTGSSRTFSASSRVERASLPNLERWYQRLSTRSGFKQYVDFDLT